MGFMQKISEGIINIWGGPDDPLASKKPGSERLYDVFYINLLKELKYNNAWFGAAGQIVSWFQRRRMITFEEVQFNENVMRFKIEC